MEGQGAPRSPDCRLKGHQRSHHLCLQGVFDASHGCLHEAEGLGWGRRRERRQRGDLTGVCTTITLPEGWEEWIWVEVGGWGEGRLRGGVGGHGGPWGAVGGQGGHLERLALVQYSVSAPLV